MKNLLIFRNPICVYVYVCDPKSHFEIGVRILEVCTYVCIYVCVYVFVWVTKSHFEIRLRILEIPAV